MESQSKHSTMETCSSELVQPFAIHRRSRKKAFRDLLLNISHKMSEENVASLQFTGELERSSGLKPSAIEVLQMLRESGKFSPNSCTDLHSMLTEINRYDLAELVLQYMDSYLRKPQSAAEESRPDDVCARYDSLTASCTESKQRLVGQPGRFSISGSHITVAHNSSEDDDGSETPDLTLPACSRHDAEDCRAQQTERFPLAAEGKSMTRDVHFQSAGSLCVGSQIHGSQVTLESGAEGGLHSAFHSTPSIPSQNGPTNIAINIQLGSTSSHSSSPLFPGSDPANKGNINTTPAIPQHSTSTEVVANCHSRTNERVYPRPTDKRRTAMCSALHETITEEQTEERKENELGSPDASSTSSTPKLSSGRSLIPAKCQRRPIDPQALLKEGHQILSRKAATAKKGQTLTESHVWRIKKTLLCQYIWYHKHRQEYTKCPKKVPINVGSGDLNPTLSLLLYPFGLFNENSSSMTLQIKLKVPDKCPPLLPTDSYTVSWEIHSQETKTAEGKLLAWSKCRIPFDRGIFYVFNLLPHDKIKLCDSPALEIHVRTSYLCYDTSAVSQAKMQVHEPEIVPKYTGIPVTMAKLLNFQVGEGRVINIAREVGGSYNRLGHYLLEDHTDTAIKKISANPQKDATLISQEILKHWVQGAGGRPVQWETLVNALRAADLSDLATNVEQNLHLNL